MVEVVVVLDCDGVGGEEGDDSWWRWWSLGLLMVFPVLKVMAVGEGGGRVGL